MKNKSNKQKRNNKLVFFLNAVHYCIWRQETGHVDICINIRIRLLWLVSKLFSSEEKKLYFAERIECERERLRRFEENELSAISFQLSIDRMYWLCWFYSMPFFVIPGCFMFNIDLRLHGIPSLIVVAVPSLWDYITVYRAIEHKKRYKKSLLSR